MKQLLFSLFVLMTFVQVQAQIYSRVVSLAPSISKSIYFLEAQDKLVGCTSYCTIAKEDGKSVVASPMLVNIEKVLSVKPDLVLASGITNPEYLETLKKFDIKVEVFLSPHTFDELCDQYVRLGKLLGLADKAETSIVDIKQEVQQIKQEARMNATPTKVFFQIGSEPLFGVTDEYFMQDYITFLNGENTMSGLKHGTISREKVVQDQPDYIFIATMGIVGEEEKAIWEKFQSIPAAKQHHIYSIDSDLACTPTPQTFLQTLQFMYDIMHPVK